MAKWIDIKGQKFGYLTAVSYTHRQLSSGRRMPAWSLKCECGKIVVAMTVNLMKGKHQSCGCKRSELTSAHYPGDSKKPEYSVYRQMLDRCYLVTAPNFSWYGAKGVTVCDRWRFGDEGKTGFQCFEADMGPRPDGLTLEREDPFKPYHPDNCRWATWAEQAVNKREHHLSAPERATLRKARSERCRGSLSPGAKLTEQQVIVIKRRAAEGASTGALALQFGVAPQTICGIKSGRNWSHVGGS